MQEREPNGLIDIIAIIQKTEFEQPFWARGRMHFSVRDAMLNLPSGVPVNIPLDIACMPVGEAFTVLDLFQLLDPEGWKPWRSVN